MTKAFDDRIIQVNLLFPGAPLTLQGLSIYATGQKFDAGPMNNCYCRIYNLTPQQRNNIVSQTTQFSKLYKQIPITINCGRLSYGTFNLFNGYINRSTVTQPPDIGLLLDCYVGNFLTGYVLSDTQPASVALSVIAQQVANNNNVSLNFLATDKNIQNFNYNGSAALQVNSLNIMGGIIASIDGGVLTVRNAGQPNSKSSRLVSAATGMVGVPEITEKGVRVTIMLDNSVNLGDPITLQSIELPTANGNYIVQRIFFDVASRDQQFYYTLDCISQNLYWGTL